MKVQLLLRVDSLKLPRPTVIAAITHIEEQRRIILLIKPSKALCVHPTRIRPIWQRVNIDLRKKKTVADRHRLKYNVNEFCEATTLAPPPPVCTIGFSPDGHLLLIFLLADVHPLQLSHVPQVVTFQLLQPVVVVLVGEVHVPLPLQAVDLQRERTADAAHAFALLAALGHQVLLLWGRLVKQMKQIGKTL